MSSTAPRPSSQQREIVYCHQCENEWYRDEHGIICPECQSDFTEIIEANNDPRAESTSPAPPGNVFGAPDPDEDDIDNFNWRPNGPGQPPGGHYHGTFSRNFTYTPGQGLQQEGGSRDGQASSGLLGLIGPVLQGLLGGGTQAAQERQQGQTDGHGQQQGQSQQEEGIHPNSPQQGQQPGGTRTTIHTARGPGYSFTITTANSSNLFPRDANAPQPLQHQPDHMERMMTQMFMNIGAFPGLNRGPGAGMAVVGPDGPVFIRTGPALGGMGGGAAAMGSPLGIGELLNMLGMPPGGQHGDAVYTQEALDRIISQLMDQHQSGNAPGPATQEAIDSLPRRKIVEKDFGDGGKADCSICMDEAPLGSDVTVLPCDHWFHHDCIQAWLNEHDTCPHCRQGIMPKEGETTDRARTPSQPPLHDTHSPAYHRFRAPGEYPFPHDGSPDPSPPGDARRSASPRAGRSGGVFSRMREAFSPRDPPASAPPGEAENSRDGGSGGHAS